MIGRSRAQRKAAAGLRAKQALEFSWARIDYTEDVVKPLLAEIADIEKTNRVELTEGDLMLLLTTGRLPIEAPDAD